MDRLPPERATARAATHSFFQGSQNVSIHGGTFNVVQGNALYRSNIYDSGDKEWIRLLGYNTAAGAFHDAGERYDAPKCHPHTREAVLKEIMDWVMDVKEKERFLWIYGPAGSGKSSIAQTIAEMCKKRGVLASDYFFSRTVPDRNNSSHLVPTLAYQLITFNPRLREYVAEAITLDRLIFSRSLEAQLEALIMRPLAQVTSSTPNSQWRIGWQADPYLIVIDGLDECGPPESQRYILTSLSSALDKLSVPLIFLIASRPDRFIRDEFNGDLSSRTRRIVLDNKYEPDNDIRMFLEFKFGDIKRRHPLAATLPSDWPVASDIDYLVHVASGQFIYASTVMKFIESPGDRPTDRLDIVLNLAPPGNNIPYAELDAVYREILLSIDKSKLESALTVFAFLFAASHMKFTPYISSFDASMLQTAAFIELFLGYKPYDLLLVLGDLHALVDVPPISAPSNLAEIRLFHPSIGDFLQDRGRSEPDLFIDMGVYCAQFAKICIRHLTPWLYSEDANFPSSSAMIQYSYRLFLQLFSTACSDDDLLRDLSQFPIDLFIKHMFDGWLPVFSLVPVLFEWINKQDFELYNVYTAHYAAYIKSRLLAESASSHPRWQYIYTAVTLNVINSDDLSTISRLFVPGFDPDPEQAMMIQKHLLGEMDFLIQSLDISDYLSRLKELLVNSSQSGKYHVDTSRYSELAGELFDMFTLPGKCLNILDDLINEQRTIIDLFYASLDRIPGNLTLGRYFRNNRHREYVSFLTGNETKLRRRIDIYVQSCNNLSADDLQASRSMDVPAMSNLSVPSPSNAKPNRTPSTVSSQEEAVLPSTSTMPVPATADRPNASTSDHQPTSNPELARPVKERGLRQKGKDFVNKIIH